MSTDQRRLGPFVLEEKLGAGGMGEVYRATHVETRRVVALKVLSAKAAGSKRIVARFARELEILKALKHPHIVRCYGGGRHENEAYLVMDLVSGGSLGSLVRRRGRLPWETVIEYGLQICDGLAYAHEWGIVHRDLTPANLLLTEDGQVKIADFGIARVQFGKRLTATKHTLGTVAYMAPEQIRGTPSVSHRTDLYTLGCVMFEMLTGRLPFTCDSTAQMLYHHLGEPPPRVSSLVMDCPIWLDHLVNQLLEKDPLKRPHDAAAVAQALREVQEKVAAGAGMAGHAASGGPSALKVPKEKEDQAEVRKLLKGKKRKKGKKSPFYERAWFLAACLLLTVGLGAWFLRSESESKLFARTEPLMASADPMDRYYAKTYCEKLLEEFPNGEYAPQARQYLDNLAMENAERVVAARLKIGGKLPSEGARLYADAYKYEQFGDRVTAIEKYQSMVDLLPDEGDERPYVNLARRQIAALTDDKTELAADRAAFLEARLKDADRLDEEGKIVEARSLWSSIVKLYGDNRELRPLVKRAQQRLADDDGESKEETAAKPAERPAPQGAPPIEQTGARDVNQAVQYAPNPLEQPPVNRPYRTRRPRARKATSESAENLPE
ncbi:MAG TPA: serine/threonine-protein kinase [Pirellulales bacterium]|nr:serine/threonine-protein kinase [Pirellulales bacterium]